MLVVIDPASYDLGNSGDTVLMQVCVKRILDRWPNASVQVFTNDPIRLVAALPGATPLGCEGRHQFFQRGNILGVLSDTVPNPLKSSVDSVESRLRMLNPTLAAEWIGWRWARQSQDAEPMRNFMALMRNADAIVATGGGYLTDEFPVHARRVCATLRLAQKLGRPTAFFGQGLGPLEDRCLRRTLRKTIPNADLVALRESLAGIQLLDELDCRTANVVVTGDDAVEAACRHRQQEPGTYLGLNLRKAHYAGVSDEHLTCVRAVIHRLVSEFRTRLVPIPISWYGETDFDIIRRVADGIPSALCDVPGLDTPDGIMRQVGRCRIVVAGSYHAGVFALSQGIPVVGLARSAYYRQKFLGLADQFGKGCSLVSLGSPDLASDLDAAIRCAWQSAGEIRPSLWKAAEDQIERGRGAYRMFFDIVEQKSKSLGQAPSPASPQS